MYKLIATAQDISNELFLFMKDEAHNFGPYEKLSGSSKRLLTQKFLKRIEPMLPIGSMSSTLKIIEESVYQSLDVCLRTVQGITVGLINEEDEACLREYFN